MALNFPSSPAVDQTYADSNGALWVFDGVKWDIAIGSIYKQFSGAKTSLNTAALLTSTPTPLDYDVEDFDTGNFYSFLNASRFTIPSTGYYRIAGTYYTGSAGAGSSYTFSLIKNGVQTVTTQIAGPNQSANYDTTAFFEGGDYIYVNVSESTSTGSLLSGSYVEISKLGTAPGLGLSRNDVFSGASVSLATNFLLSSTPTAITWPTPSFDVNADVLGSPYWSAGSPTRLTVKVTGYYQIKAFLTATSAGTQDSYTLTLRKNGTTTITTATIGPLDNINIDEIYSFAANDYIEIVASNSGSVGGVATGSYLEIIRLGI